MTFMKAVIVNLDAIPPLPIPVMFNPPEYSLQSTSNFVKLTVPGLPSSVMQYIGSNIKTFEADLFFDSTDTGIDVRANTANITELMDKDERTNAPPNLLLLWGSLVFPCILDSVTEVLSVFDAFGLPLRSTLKVKFTGHDVLTSIVAKLPIAQVAAASGYVIKVGEDLAGIAAAKYGDPSQWRKIAQANGIDDPRRLTVGQTLQLPGLS